jgi:hypothetical protein
MRPPPGFENTLLADKKPPDDELDTFNQETFGDLLDSDLTTEFDFAGATRALLPPEKQHQQQPPLRYDDVFGLTHPSLLTESVTFVGW